MRDRDELEALVAYYKSELGLVTEATQVAKVRLKCNATNSEARVLLALYGAKGRILSQDALFEIIPHVKDGENSGAIRMHVRALRRKIGPEVVTTTPGLGYQIGQLGRETVEQCL